MNRHALSIIEIFDLCPDFRLRPTLLQYIALGWGRRKGRVKIREGSDPGKVGLKPHEKHTAATSTITAGS